MGLDLLTLVSYNKKINEEGGYCNEWTSGTRHGLFILRRPQTGRILMSAAKLATAFHAAQFTALYVSKSPENSLPVEEQKRLQNNIQYAEDLGAAITTVIGENISFQIAEFTRISGVTKIVIGRSNTRRYHFWDKQTVTEQLISIAPNIDIYIIPDSKANIKENQRKRFAQQIIPTGKDILITTGMLFAMTLLSLAFRQTLGLRSLTL